MAQITFLSNYTIYTYTENVLKNIRLFEDFSFAPPPYQKAGTPVVFVFSLMRRPTVARRCSIIRLTSIITDVT